MNRIEVYQSNSGQLFHSEVDCLKDDMIHLMTQSEAINDASAKKLVDFLCDEDNRLAIMAGIIYDIRKYRGGTAVASDIPEPLSQCDDWPEVSRNLKLG